MRTFDKRILLTEAPLLCAFTAIGALCILLVHSVVVPLYGTVLQREDEFNHYQSIISSENGYQLLKNEISVKIDTLENRLAPVPEQKKVTADPGSYLELLIDIGRASDVRFARIQPQEERQVDDITRYPVVLTLTTTYHELGQFVALLEKMPNLFSVDRIAIQVTNDRRCSVRLLVTCLIPKETGNG